MKPVYVTAYGTLYSNVGSKTWSANDLSKLGLTLGSFEWSSFLTSFSRTMSGTK